jgi:6,7-dimethyl-8-ribityllumazine synthase
MSRKAPQVRRHAISRAARVAVIAARFNQDIVDELLDGCVVRLLELGLPVSSIDIHRVPGAFELPVAAKLAAKSGRFSAVICLGAVIRGDTPHFDFIASETARGIQQVAVEEAVPVIFGVLTTDNLKQARERTGGKHGHAGKRAADAAIEMIQFTEDI